MRRPVMLPAESRDPDCHEPVALFERVMITVDGV
jgi:hypothetical protein